MSLSEKECSSIPSSEDASSFFTNLHPIKGSYRNASTIAIIDYLLFLKSFIIFSQVCLKIP